MASERSSNSLMHLGKQHKVGDPHCSTCEEGFPKRHEGKNHDDCGGLMHREATTTECDKCNAVDFIIPERQPSGPSPTFEDEGSVFAGRTINYCVEKLYEFIDHPNSAIATHVAGFGWEQIINTLRDLEAKARRYGANPEHSQFPTALFAAMELQQYVNKQTSSITGETEARIYLQSLEHDLDELRRWERDIDEGHGNPAA